MQALKYNAYKILYIYWKLLYIIKASIEGMYYKYNVYYYTLHFNACLLQMHLLLNILACVE